MNVGDRIKQRRDQLGLSATRLAERANISKGYVSGLESGTNTTPSADVLYDIAQALDTTVGALLGREQLPAASSLPDALRSYVEGLDISDAEVASLAQVRYLGGQPETADDWRFLHGALRRTIR